MPPPEPRRWAGPRQVVLASPVDWPGFVRASRWLVQQGCPPDAVQWLEAPDALAAGQAAAQPGTTTDLFAAEPLPAWASHPAASLPQAPALGLRAPFVAMARRAALHAHPGRWAALYGAVWRVHQQPAWADDALDPALCHLHSLARQASRDAHKMKAFVRFRPVPMAKPELGSAPVPAPGAQPTLRHVAWFEPAHHVQEWVAPFFVRRFANMAWLILTPRVSLAWDGQRLQRGAGASATDAPPADAGEALWLAYYQSIFNPARLNLAMMRREMPSRYWHNLPEAQLIAPLAQAAAQRTGQMLARSQDGAAATTRRRRKGQLPGRPGAGPTSGERP